MSKVYKYNPVAWDSLAITSTTTARPGQEVEKYQPAGTPKNGTMGNCYIRDAQTKDPLGMVRLTSLA